MSTTNSPDEPDIGDDLSFICQETRSAGGTWVIGLVAGHRFHALVFPAAAGCPDYELGNSRISKLWLQRIADDRVVFNWDRGLDVPAADGAAQAVVDFLAAGSRSTPAPREAGITAVPMVPLLSLFGGLPVSEFSIRLTVRKGIKARYIGRCYMDEPGVLFWEPVVGSSKGPSRLFLVCETEDVCTRVAGLLAIDDDVVEFEVLPPDPR